MKQLTDALESGCNVALGCAINWSVLVWVYGQPITASAVTLTMIALTFSRSFVLRRLFRYWGQTRPKRETV